MSSTSDNPNFLGVKNSETKSRDIRFPLMGRTNYKLSGTFNIGDESGFFTSLKTRRFHFKSSTANTAAM